MIRPEDESIIDLSISCTIDEAVAYLLDLKQGPRRIYIASEDSRTDEYYDVSLHEILSNDSEAAEIDYSNAKAEKLPAEVIAEKCAELEKCEMRIAEARKYLSDLVEELAKEGASALRKDILATKNPQYPYITLSSLKQWADEKYGITLFDDLDSPGEIQTKSQGHRPPRLKLREQEKIILAEIKRLRYNPKALPKNEAGKSGVKAAVRDALKQNPLFEGTKVFDKAWQRLRDLKEIANVE